LLEVRDLSVHYRGAIAVHGVSLTVAQGEAVSIIGPNGAGKTSLLRAISGLVPYDGEVRYEGLSLRGMRPDRILRAGLVHCPEAGELFGEMTVEENLELGAYMSGIPGHPGSLERVHALPSSASGKARWPHAERRRAQMLAIGRSLMSRPALMMDEPSLGLSPLMRSIQKDSANHQNGTCPLSWWSRTPPCLEVAQRLHLIAAALSRGACRSP
jgi:branched-chain amino acid transport system ATP-binding protein